MFDFDADIDLTFDVSKTLRIRRITRREKFPNFVNANGQAKEGYGLGGGREGRIFFVADCASFGNPRYELDRLAALLLLFKKEKVGDSPPSFSIEFGGKSSLKSSAFLDDCSRYLPAATLGPEATTDTVLETLEEALSAGRTPKQILSDHGTQYWSNDGPGRFTTYCMEHGIEHILSSTGKPTTQRV